jgi:hypothetical protein
MRRSISLLALLLVFGTAMPASAQPQPLEFDDFLAEPFFDHGVVMFANVGRTAFCDWAASGFDDDSFPDAPMPGLVEHEVGQGAVVRHTRGDVHVEVWVPEGGALTVDGVCGGGATLFATGRALWVWNDNDFHISLTRANSFGGSVSGTLTATDGQRWRLRWGARLQIDRNDEFHLRSITTTLVPIGRGG